MGYLRLFLIKFFLGFAGTPVLAGRAAEPKFLTDPTFVRLLLIALMCLVAVIVAGVAGFCAKRVSGSIWVAIIAGGAAFAGTIVLMTTIMGVVVPPPS